MNILLLSPWLPWPPYDGGRIRILETLRYLSRHHSVTLATSVCRADEIDHASFLSDYCANIITTVRSNETGAVFSRLSRGMLNRRPLIQSFYFNTALARSLRDLTSRVSYDVIQVEFPFLSPYLEALDPHRRAKRVLSMHNVESLRFERELRLAPWGKRKLLLLGDHLFFREWEKKALRLFDGIVAVSDLERSWIQRHAPEAIVELAPNGVDTEYFVPASTATSERDRYIVFTGAMDYPPNVDAARWFCDDILPALQQKMPRLGFKIVGKNPDAQIIELGKRNRVQVTGTVADIRCYLAEAIALVVPLRSGGGTRLKILEAMAMDRPVVSTSVGAEGLEITPGTDILIANDVQQFVDQVELLVKSPETSNRIGSAGRRLVMQKYDWRVCLGGLERLYGTLLRSEAA